MRYTLGVLVCWAAVCHARRALHARQSSLPSRHTDTRRSMASDREDSEAESLSVAKSFALSLAAFSHETAFAALAPTLSTRSRFQVTRSDVDADAFDDHSRQTRSTLTGKRHRINNVAMQEGKNKTDADLLGAFGGLAGALFGATAEVLTGGGDGAKKTEKAPTSKAEPKAPKSKAEPKAKDTVKRYKVLDNKELNVFASPDSDEIIRKLKVGEIVESDSKPVVVDGFEMLAIKPKGAVDMSVLEAAEATKVKEKKEEKEKKEKEKETEEKVKEKKEEKEKEAEAKKKEEAEPKVEPEKQEEAKAEPAKVSVKVKKPAASDSGGASVVVRKPAEKTASTAPVSTMKSESGSGTMTVKVKRRATAATIDETSDEPDDSSVKISVKKPGDDKKEDDIGYDMDKLSDIDKMLIEGTRGMNCSKLLEALQAGANPDVLDKQGRTPLHFAAGIGLAPAAVLLIHFGAKVDAQDFEGLTPLHMASGYANSQSIKVLVAAGADTNRISRTPGPIRGTPFQVVATLGEFQYDEFMNRTAAQKVLKKKDDRLEKLKACMDVLDDPDKAREDMKWNDLLEDVLKLIELEKIKTVEMKEAEELETA